MLLLNYVATLQPAYAASSNKAVSCLDAGGSAVRASPPMLLLNMSLRSKPLLRLRPTRLCLALMLAARRFGSSTPPRENRACRAPGPRRLDVPCHRFAPNCFCIPTEQWACCLSALRVGAQVGPPPYPAPWQSACATHSFDAFGQTLNYFTSRAAAIWRYRERSGQRRRWEPS
jgi:hypothetical protein